MTRSTQPRPTIRYVAFDNRTGRILQTHSRISASTRQYVEVPVDELRRMLAKDSSLLAKLTDKDPANLDILKIESHDEAPVPGEAAMVDVVRRRIVRSPMLTLTADKREVSGDGQDSATIEIRAVNAAGNLMHSVNDRVKVSATHGKLSARAGIVDLVGGRATITVTSVNETVDKVKVWATSLSGACSGGSVTLEFV
jgi:hypothetical protein